MNEPKAENGPRGRNDAFVQGASGGVGRELTRQLLATDRFGIVHASCRRPEEAQGLIDLAEAHPGRLELHALDVTREESIVRVAGSLKERGRRLGFVVNGSGLLHGPSMSPEKRLAEVVSNSLEESFRVNALGPLLVIKHLIGLVPRHDRSVVASLSARVGSIGDNRLGGWYAYRGSKAALNMFQRTLAVEFGRSHPGCICVALHPGTVDTALSRPFQVRVAKDRLFSPERAARQLLDVLFSLEPRQSGSFLAWDGTTIPW